MADWLQGPYVYALYASYGFSGQEIAELFVAGFGASAVFGTFVGSLADRWGRKKCAVLYCVLYAMSCVTKHSNLYSILMLGRILGGIATSLLFSTFECWMVAEHCQKRQFSGALLRHLFGLMFFGMYATAIVAGLIAQIAADAAPLQPVEGYSHFYVGGYTAPFDLSLILLLVTIFPICILWGENYGDSTGGMSFYDTCKNACQVVCTSWRILILGLVVASFEGCMFAFVFNWTPALDSKSVPPPHGLIFSLFMMACMCGASAFSLTDAKPSTVLLPTFVLAAASLGAVAFCLQQSSAMLPAIFYSFLVFEFCVGVYFPAMGTLKSEVVPEESRAGVYNIYRVPLNVVVCVLLLSSFKLTSSFYICCVLLVVAIAGLASFTVNPIVEGKKAATESP
eukprot:gnl/TRDRNA2_/TRDRNA2_154626_c1_seq1.p1 gnl/TRDRNA2_/TRDRNA2_154626_c1~~gnl/TRDRNA2_/TRDRNA2_154626_c1_seq1.p1  ORF type:complete len:459 (+),score=86.40 gnl/TRDRNA2_/TRDRNA2_154626_c1_seq1:191-1378(+)